MTRFLLAFALLGLASPAFAALGPDDEDALDDILMDTPAPKTEDKKKEEPVSRAAPKQMGNEPVEEFDLLSDDVGEVEPNFLGDLSTDEEDVPVARVSTVRKTTSAPGAAVGPIKLDVAGKEPLADNYPASIVAVDRDAVVVELPVLIARSRVGMDQPFALIAEIYVGDTKVSTIRQTVEPASLAEFGPSFAFLKVLAPVVEQDGELTLKVMKAKVDGSGATELFSRSTPYSL